MKDLKYERELRHAGPKAKAMRTAMKSFLERATDAYIASHVEENDEKRRPLVQDALDFGMAIDSLIREHAMHVVWGGEPETEVRRLAVNTKSSKAKKALEKLAEQLSGAKPARKQATNEDDGRFE